MEILLQSLGPLAAAALLLPLGLCGAAWALRMACAICTVRVPEFAPATAVVVVCVMVNLGLRMMLHHNGLALGLTSQLLLVLLASATIISFSVRMSIASALAVTITQAFLCGVMAFSINQVGSAML